MAAEPAYSYYGSEAPARQAPARQAQRTPERAPRISVVPGGRTGVGGLGDAALLAARIFAAVVVVVALLGFARVALSAATLEASAATEELEEQIDTARAGGATLETTTSVLSNSTRIAQEAAALGMVKASSTEVITLAADVVVCDEAGNLSLSLSVAQAAALAG